jgi:hypothetical protein
VQVLKALQSDTQQNLKENQIDPIDKIGNLA